MKNVDIMSITSAYAAQKEKGDGIKLPAKIAWTRRVNMDKLFHAKGLIEEAMKEVGQKYSDDEHSTEAEEGRKIKPEYIADFAKEQGDILVQETEIEIRKVKISDLGDIELSDADMDTLAFMLEDSEQ